MIAIILAAGTGTRLRPLTENIPKALLKLNDVTIIERLVKSFVSNDVKKFIFVVGHYKEKVEKISEILAEKYKINIDIVENKKYDQTNTSCSTYLASKDIDEDFILVNGDNIMDSTIIEKIVKSNHSSMVIDNDKKLTEESFKIIVDNGIIKDIGKELEINESYGEFIGLSKVIKKDLNEFNKILLNLIKEDPQNYYDYAYEELSKKNHLDFILTNGLKWTEIDDHDDWEYAKKLANSFDNI